MKFKFEVVNIDNWYISIDIIIDFAINTQSSFNTPLRLHISTHVILLNLSG